MFLAAILLSAGSLAVDATTYTLAKEYVGTNFFSDWSYYGSWDNLTGGAHSALSRVWSELSNGSSSGDTNWVTAQQGVSQQLTYVNDAGHAIIKADNTSNVPNQQKRDAVCDFLCTHICGGLLSYLPIGEDHVDRLVPYWQCVRIGCRAYSMGLLCMRFTFS